MYKPQLSELISVAGTDWEIFDTNDLVHYGIPYIDDSLYGIDIENGELIGIQAPEKNRKTTFAFNILYNIADDLKKRNLWVAFDTLESGMPPKACRDQFIAMRATRELIARTFSNRRHLWPKVEAIRKDVGYEKLVISKEYLRYAKTLPIEIGQCISRAKEALSTFPISIFGPSIEEGNTRNLKASIDRWDLLYHGNYPTAIGQNYRIFVSDNIQLYYGFGSDKFDQMEEVVATQANFLVTHPGSVVITISQMGKTSLTNRRYGIEAYAKGGGALAAEATVLFETSYDKEVSPDQVIISVPQTRKKPPPAVIQDLDRESGAFLGPARLLRKE